MCICSAWYEANTKKRRLNPPLFSPERPMNASVPNARNVDEKLQRRSGGFVGRGRILEEQMVVKSKENPWKSPEISGQSTLLETNSSSHLKMDVWNTFPVSFWGKRPIFRCELLVSGQSRWVKYYSIWSDVSILYENHMNGWFIW